jgi:hypothetical protein
VYPTETVYANKKKRAPSVVINNPQPTTVTPTAIPAYASPCSGSVRYSSACSCIGVTPSIAIAPTPTTVITVPGPTQTVVETRAYVHFEGFTDEVCTGSNPQSNVFVQGECNFFLYPDSLFLTGITPGSCTDTSSCYINFYNSDDCASAFVGSVPSSEFSTCQVIDNSVAGLLVCLDC